jgi:hypothetical protein
MYVLLAEIVPKESAIVGVGGPTPLECNLSLATGPERAPSDVGDLE